MGFSNLSKFPEMHTGFQILRCTKFDIPNSSGKYQKPRIHLSLEFDFYFGNSWDEDKSTLYVPSSPYLLSTDYLNYLNRLLKRDIDPMLF